MPGLNNRQHLCQTITWWNGASDNWTTRSGYGIVSTLTFAARMVLLLFWCDVNKTSFSQLRKVNVCYGNWRVQKQLRILQLGFIQPVLIRAASPGTTGPLLWIKGYVPEPLYLLTSCSPPWLSMYLYLYCIHLLIGIFDLGHRPTPQC